MIEIFLRLIIGAFQTLFYLFCHLVSNKIERYLYRFVKWKAPYISIVFRD